jgi:hypothetical protein
MISFIIILQKMAYLLNEKHSLNNLSRKDFFCITIILWIKKSKSLILSYLLTLPLFVGVSRVRALSTAWTGSHARETLISRTHLFLPHDFPPTKKSSTIKSWPTFCDQYISGISPFGTPALMKNAERYECKWYPVIDLFDTFTGKLGHGD